MFFDFNKNGIKIKITNDLIEELIESKQLTYILYSK